MKLVNKLIKERVSVEGRYISFHEAWWIAKKHMPWLKDWKMRDILRQHHSEFGALQNPNGPKGKPGAWKIPGNRWEDWIKELKKKQLSK